MKKTTTKKKYAINDNAVKILRKVKKMILDNPRTYDQLSFCGTACCIAGKVALLSGARRIKGEHVRMSLNGKDSDVDLMAQEILGINNKQTYALFYDWAYVGDFRSGDFEDLFADAKSKQAKAEVAAKRIEHFIKTGK